MRAALLILLAALTGCEVGEKSVSASGQPNYGVSEIRLKDDTRCVLYVQRAIVCDWSTGEGK